MREGGFHTFEVAEPGCLKKEREKEISPFLNFIIKPFDGTSECTRAGTAVRIFPVFKYGPSLIEQKRRQRTVPN